ncbi:LOW QUALITY PROTEIN: aquaporin-12-like [Cinclus cinclus]|uniref:LOW QUALITY PROTEIN: aquaporin-12-like n=1 Tax=Cinclus cinclus TaxID=127875 RepID=UPI002E119A3E
MKFFVPSGRAVSSGELLDALRCECGLGAQCLAEITPGFPGTNNLVAVPAAVSPAAPVALALPRGGHTCGLSQACGAVPRLLLLAFIKRRVQELPLLPPRLCPSTAFTMDGLNVSIAFFFLVVGVCQVLRWLSKRLLSHRTHGCLAREFAGSFQLCTSCLELRMLMDIGPWSGGFGLDVVLTLLFLLSAVHGASSDGASANPTVSLQEFLLLESSLAVTVAKLLAQGVGAGTGWAVTRLYWSWELTQLHFIQNLIAPECSSSIRASLPHAAFVEGSCSFLFHLVLLKVRQSHPLCRVPALAAIVTFLTYTAGPFTGAFFNPALATATTFQCSGSSFWDYIQVYWLGPLTGMLVALLLFQGNIPRLFQKNLLYSQKSKYKVPKAKVTAQVEGDKPQRKRKGGKSNSEPRA